MANHTSEHHHDEHEHEEHIGIPGYLGVFAVLVVGTILTYWVALIDLDFIFPGANTLVALLIAFTKMTCVMKREQLRSDYDTAYIGEEKLVDKTATWHIQLTPKRVVSYKLVDLWVDREGMPRQVKITERNNDTTTVLLTNIRKNDTIKGSAFDIKPPKGTSVRTP